MSVQPLVLTRHFKAPPERLICSAIAFLDKFPESADLLAASPNVRRGQAAMAARPSFAATQPT